MIFEQHYLACLSQASYLIGDASTKTAVVVDPRRDVELYLERAAALGLTIRHVFLTHFHGDHCNGLPGFIGSLPLNQRDEALDVIGPVGLKRWFKTLRELQILWPGFPVRTTEVSQPGVVFEGDGFKVEAYPLRHRVTTWG